MILFHFYLLISSLSFIISLLPEKDLSEKCLSCEKQVYELQKTWTNETSVTEILLEMQEKCKSYPFMQQHICDKIAEIFVQIPPALFQGMEDLAWPIPEAMCATIRQCKVYCCNSESLPEQVHLSLLSKDHTMMGVTWVTLNGFSSIVQYGLHPDQLVYTSEGSLDTYTSAGWVGTIHRAVMTSLVLGQTYYYRVGGGDTNNTNSFSNIFKFTTLLPQQTITYAVIADMDFGEASDGTVSDLKELVNLGRIQAVIHSGDISYADGYEPHWDAFFNKIQPIAATVPYMVSPGNHEFWYNFSSYKHRFTMPGYLFNSSSSSVIDVNDGSGDNMFYSWNAGFAHFISISSESPIDTAYISEIEMDFIESDLIAATTTSNLQKHQSWIIAHFHRPMYCSNDKACLDYSGKEYGNAIYLRKKLEEMFMKYHVNLVLQGHVHAYERTYPVYNETLVATNYLSPTAPTYILQGSSGNREGNKGLYPPPDELPVWSAAQHNEVGYALLTVSENTLSWQFYSSSNKEQNIDAVLLDQFEIKN